jgi:glycosyltransferase domain-containing protein
MSEATIMTGPIKAYTDPFVTIGLPTYNRPESLQKCLETILSQTYPHLEIVISDNCSAGEEVQKIILEYAEKDDRIRHYRQSENIGLEENFNFVFSKSTADYFMWMSDDDHFDANYVEECVHFLERNPGYVLCSGIAKYYREGKYAYDEKMLPLHQKKAVARLLKYYWVVNNNGKFYGVFRNRLLAGKPLDVHIGCDLSFMGKLAILGKLTYVGTTCYHRSLDGNSATKKKMIKRFRLNKLKSIFFEIYISYEIATHIFTDKRVKQAFNFLSRKLLTTIIFFEVNLLLVVVLFKKIFHKK